MIFVHTEKGENVNNKEAIKKLLRIRKHYQYIIPCEETIAIDMAIEALSADAVSRYAEWLEQLIVDAESFEWLCDETPIKEWCDNNCHYSSIQAECLQQMYEASKGGDSE